MQTINNQTAKRKTRASTPELVSEQALQFLKSQARGQLDSLFTGMEDECIARCTNCKG